MNHACCRPSISPARALAIGLPDADVCALYGLTQEQLDELVVAGDARKAKSEAEPDRPKPGCLMTKVLERPDLAGWAFQTIMRRK